jgi:anti-sigma B factor antagonist
VRLVRSLFSKSLHKGAGSPCDDLPRGFNVSVDLSGLEAVIDVRGEVDVATAPDLATDIDAVIAMGYRRVVLNLADTDFIDLAGLRAIANATSLLSATGGDLTIRSPSDAVTRTLEIASLGGLVNRGLPLDLRLESPLALPVELPVDSVGSAVPSLV